MGVNVLTVGGRMVGAAEQGQPAAGGGMLPLLIIGGLLIAFMIWSNRRRQKQAQNFRANLRPGQRVQLYAGLLGTIVTIGEREVFIELAPGVVVSAVPQAVQGIVPDPVEDTPEDPADTGTDEDTER